MAWRGWEGWRGSKLGNPRSRRSWEAAPPGIKREMWREEAWARMSHSPHTTPPPDPDEADRLSAYESFWAMELSLALIDEEWSLWEEEVRILTRFPPERWPASLIEKVKGVLDWDDFDPELDDPPRPIPRARSGWVQ